MTTWPASIATATAGATAVAADFNSHRDGLKVIGEAWQTYTPVWTSTGTPPTMGATTVAGSYRLTGKTIDVHMLATVGAGFAAGTLVYRFSLPAGVTPLRTTSHDAVGVCVVWDASGSSAYPLTVFQSTSTQVAMINATPTAMGPTVPITWATGDTISIHIPALEIA